MDKAEKVAAIETALAMLLATIPINKGIVGGDPMSKKSRNTTRKLRSIIAVINGFDLATALLYPSW
jgi:hypothetical protein